MLWSQTANTSEIKFAETVSLLDTFKSNLKEIHHSHGFFQLQCILPFCHVQTSIKLVIITEDNEKVIKD